MATTVRPKPYFLDLNGRIDTLSTVLPSLMSNADSMFQILFQDLRGVAADLATLTTVVGSGGTGKSIVGAASSMGSMGFDEGDSEELCLFGPPAAFDTLPLFTQGSVIFAGPGGELAQDNAEFFWDNTNFRLGIGTAAPAVALDAIGSAQVTNGSLIANRSTVSFTSLTPPAATATPALAGLGAGNLSNGVYKYIVEFLTALGQTNGNVFTAGVTVVNNATNGQVLLSVIPTDSTGTATARNIYRSLVNAINAAYLVGTVADNTTTTFTDNVADATLLAANVQVPADNTTSGPIMFDGVKAIVVGAGQPGNIAASNTGIGASALMSLTGGSQNCAIGALAGNALTSGAQNTLIGASVGKVITSGGQNSILGFGAGAALSTASQAVFFGFQAGNKTTTGASNVFIGSDAGQTNVTGASNVAVGQQAFQVGLSSDNVIVGTFAGISLTSGGNNTMIGYEAGFTATSGNATTTGANNTFVGFQSGAGSATQFTNSSALGNGALVLASNQVSLGNSAVTTIVVPAGSTTQLATYSHTGAEVDLTYQIYTPVTLATVTMSAGQSRAIVNPAGTIAALTVTLPPSPVNGQVAGISFTQIVTTLTVNAPGGATVVAAPTTAAVDTNYRFLYQASSTSWFPAS